MNPLECLFVGGKDDTIFGSKQNATLKHLVPDAIHIEINGHGHMVNLEAPEWLLRKS